jgi:transcriptional regulator with XRE-family HTH domain
MHEFYNRIRKVFERAGSNRSQFCRKYGHHYQTLQAYWNSDKLPSGKVLEDLATEFHVSIDALVLGGPQESTEDNPVIARIVQFLREQDEDGLLKIDGALQMFRHLELSSERASPVSAAQAAGQEIMPDKSQRASNLLVDLAQLIRRSGMDDQEKKSASKMVSQVIHSIYEREGKDEWAQLEEIT